MPNQRAKGVTVRTVAFPDELWELVVEYAEVHEVIVSTVVRDAVADYVKRNVEAAWREAETANVEREWK